MNKRDMHEAYACHLLKNNEKSWPGFTKILLQTSLSRAEAADMDSKRLSG
jgi:hypothetical protein